MEDTKKVKQETEEAKIARIEAKHGKIAMVISFDQGAHVGYLKMPDRVLKDKVLAAVKDAPHHAAEIMINNILIKEESSSIFLTDDGYLLGAFQLAQELISIKQGEIKKN